MKNNWERDERINELAETLLNVVGMVLLIGGGFGMSLLWLMGVIG